MPDSPGSASSAGDRVAVISDNRIEWAVGAYATYGLGAAWVPMYEAQLAKEWKFILGNSGAKVAIVGDDGIRAQLDDLRDTLPELKQIVVIRGEAGGEAITWAEMLARGAEYSGFHPYIRLPRISPASSTRREPRVSRRV